MKCSIATSVGQRKHLSSRRESNPWPPRYRLGALTTELRESHSELGHLLAGSYVTRVLHTARINDIDSIICVLHVVDFERFEICGFL